MIKKICVKCEKEKPLSQFYKNNQRIDKVDNKCKICKNAHVKEWYEKRGGKVKQKEYSKKSYEKKKAAKPPKVKKEKNIKPKKPVVSYNRRISILISDSDARNIECKCKDFGIDKSQLIRELIKNFLDKLEYSKPTKLELLPINISDFKIDGYSIGLEE